jgi:hypothetical protein
MKSVRLERDQELRLREAALQYGITQSEFIRRAIDKACEEALGQPTLYDLVKDIIDPPDQEEIPPEQQTDYARRHSEVVGEIIARKHAHYLDSARGIVDEIERRRAE